MKAARGRRMQGPAHFLSCFKFIHWWGERKSDGRVCLALSFISHVEGWNNINISFSLKLHKSNSYYCSNSSGRTHTHVHPYTPTHTPTHILFWTCNLFFFGCSYPRVHLAVTAWTVTSGLITQRPFSTLADPAVISPKQVLWLASAVSSILTLGQAGPTIHRHIGYNSGERFNQRSLAGKLLPSSTICFVGVLLKIDFPFVCWIIISFLYNTLVESL